MKRIGRLILGICTLTVIMHAKASAEFAVVDNTSSLNLRSGPGYEYQITGRAARYEWIDVRSGNGVWDYVTVVRTGQSGYMVDSYLKRAGSGGAGTGIVKNRTATGFLNLREYPSYSAKVLGIYYNGAVCRVINNANGWYMVEIDGMIGYFRHEFLVVSGASSATVTAANGKPVNLRSGPSTAYQAVCSIKAGTPVSVLLKGNGFWQISANGTTGFMSSAYLSEGKGADDRPVTSGYLIVTSPNQGKVNLRVQPSSSAKVLTQYASGTRLEVIEGGLSWCKVYGKSSGLTGYIMTRFTTVYGLPGTPTKTVSNGRSYVNLRSAPSAASGKVLKRVNSGERVTVLVPGDEWTLVRYGNTDGYMMTHFLK